MVNKKLLFTLIILFASQTILPETNFVETSFVETEKPQTQIWLPSKKTLLDPRIEILAKHANAHLNSNPLFNTKLLRKSDAVREYLTSQHRGGGTQHTCTTVDNETIEYTYFDRGSDQLIIVGPGFSNRELMAPFVGMFDCDVVIFDHRGHEYKPIKWYNPSTWKLNPIRLFFHLNSRKIRLGEVEHNDVISIVTTLKQQKNYAQVCGLGICYSAVMFVKAHAIYKEQTGTNLFDKLICDGIWPSLRKQIERRASNPLTFLPHPYRNFCQGNRHQKLPVNKRWFTPIALKAAEILTGIPFRKLNLNLLDYLHPIDIPVLFFHSKDDKSIPLDEFQSVWNNATQTKQKVALITPNHLHCRKHLKDKEFYKLICDSFMELEFEQFIDGLQNPGTLVTQELAKYQKRLCALS
ncbi:alpha/beta hydrolase [Candidatus Babeliales bacterium]|nr:alpha/beta hydrolase [Candidatus Babeliales bacterium]